MSQAVLGGVESSRTPIVYLRARQEGYRPSQCSATLIAPNLVLTALHCISDYVDGTYTCNSQGAIDDRFPRDPTEAGRLGAPFSPESIEVFTSNPVDTMLADAVGVDVVSPRADSICRNDLAFVVLDRDLEVGTLPVRMGRGMIAGETVTVVGFGINEEQINLRKEKSGLKLQGVGPSEFYEVEGQAPPRTFGVGQGPCPGDSGGPAISDETGEVVGVFSFFFGGDCSSSLVRAIYSQVAAFEPFARDAFERAGHLELLEPEPDPDPMKPDPEPGLGGASGGSPLAGAGGEGSAETGGSGGGGGCALHPGGAHPPWGGLLLLLLPVLLRRSRDRNVRRSSGDAVFLG